MRKLLLGTVFFAMMAISQPSFADETAKDLKLFVLNCGKVHVGDLNVFSDTDQYLGQKKTLNVGCYLIKHNDDWLLWDTGISSNIANEPDGIKKGAFHLTLEKTITQQLETLGLKPQDITHVGLSHGHFDHSGNVNLFTNATLIIQHTEYDMMKNHKEEALSTHMDPQYIEYFLGDQGSKQTKPIKGDVDIFEDGTVKAISLPGHTPGHMALLVNLPKAGPVVLSGDQWHFKENHESNGVPSFNYNRADTLASSDKLNRLIKNRGAKLIIQHEIEDNKGLPKIPEAIE